MMTGLPALGQRTPRLAVPLRRRLGSLVWILIAAGAPLSFAGCSGSRESSCQAAFWVEETLTNARTDAVTLSLRTAPGTPELELRVAYAARGSGDLDLATPPQLALPDTRVDLELGGLAPGTAYAYRVECRDTPAERWSSRAEHSFDTAPTPGTAYRFALVADSHAVSVFAQAECGLRGKARGRVRSADLKASFANLVAREPDFALLLGDEIITHRCGSCGRPNCLIDGVALGQPGLVTVRAASEAEARYRLWLRIWQPVFQRIPYFLALGNHDGETRFGSPDGQCKHFDDTSALSQAARHRYLANPHAAYPDGDASGNYYRFSWGDADFFVIDPFQYTTATESGDPHGFPRDARDWHLGAEQLAWLQRSLAASTKAWKFVASHHLVGGLTLGRCYAYGRGGIAGGSTADGTTAGALLGEQALIQAALKQAAPAFFLFGHDHVAVVGQKRDARGPTGVHYIAGGTPSVGQPSSWAGNPAFAASYDYDQSGIPDYRETHGSEQRGFFEVTVDGPRSVRFDYIVGSAADASRNGVTAISYRVEGPGARVEPAGEEW